jgi:hypothetical protein
MIERSEVARKIESLREILSHESPGPVRLEMERQLAQLEQQLDAELSRSEVP